ncbi:MAG: hydroxyacid dehydrogenase [candidate division Zixibacteria bacterium]|nr:hydroxyacid dehydrogenase [candidate division Zixibacteria bacterium]MDH3936720.1 hydroxyacid dehydrogenase [candidate division Zixibacteria bacterium]MDH4032573.1 hydroxyacid dehydrogenase [candidate division Zixibacteria bacterium]
MKQHVHVLSDFDDLWIQQLASELDNNTTLSHGKEIPIPDDCHVLVAGLPTREQITSCHNLHSLIIPWSGLPKATRELMLDLPHIAIYNLHHNAAAVAEHAVALMLAASKSIVPIDRRLRQNDWTPRYEPSSSPLLEKKTALILGYGAIGRRIARACAGLGMEVHAVKRNFKGIDDPTTSLAPLGIPQLHDSRSMNDYLPQAAALFVCLPLSPATEGLIGEHELSLLPDDSIVINIARGRVIDEAALYRALKSGRIRAGLDTWYLYPQDESSRSDQPPSEFAFHELENVVMTPHLAGHCSDIETHRIQALARLLNRLADGHPLPDRVDPERGY